MKQLIFIFFLFSMLQSCLQNKDYTYSWNFDNASGEYIFENITQTKYVVQTKRQEPEYSEGLIDTGLRLDGNSTFIRGAFPTKVQLPITISAWVAAETFPTDTAGFYAVSSDSNDEMWVSVCMDKFGYILLGTKSADEDKSYLRSDVSIPKFEWHNLTLVIESEKINLLLDGESIVSKLWPSKNKFFEFIVIGRDIPERFVHIFPTMHFNGMIDEITLWNRALSVQYINQKLLGDRVGQKAKLAIANSRFKNDFNRPKYHLLPSAQWTNETHGLIYDDSRYHIFNQKNGTNVFLGQINWGHFSSSDLLKWTEHKPALTPEEGYDQMGIWSGHVVKDDKGVPTIFYTGGDGTNFGICMASPLDSALISWQKYPENPVIKGPPPGYAGKDFRDPYVWREGDKWYMIVGYGVEENSQKKGAVLLYSSRNLKKWESLGTLFMGNPSLDHSGVFWEMPVFWKEGDSYILLVNPIPFNGKPAVAIYWEGNFINEIFIPNTVEPKRLEVINRLLSPSVTKDKEGTTTAISIIPDLIPAELQLKNGWTHLYSIPRTWTLKDGFIWQSPHPVLKKLRENETVINKQTIYPGKNLKITKGQQVEIILEIDPQQSKRFGLVLGKSSIHNEETKILFDLTENSLSIDLNQSSQEALIEKKVEKGFFYHLSKPIKLHLFIDGSVIEGFINDKEAFSTRIFPVNIESCEVELFSSDQPILLLKAQMWDMRSTENEIDF